MELFLDKINSVEDLRSFKESDLKKISDELRKRTIEAVSNTGGHLGAGLGVVELTVALHYVFNTPIDTLIWDVGHQSYPHKILTGRKDRINTLRQPNGLSGFTKRSESIFDAFGAGHSSTSISAALGFNVAKKIKNENSHTIAVIGDGAMSAGMAFEALNNAGGLDDAFYLKNRLIVILNDNDMSIAPPVGAISNYLSRLASSRSYLKIRDIFKKTAHKINAENFAKFLRKFEKTTKEWWMGGNIFEEMGFYYIGPIDGHNLDILIPILKNIRDDNSTDPILIHCITQKGRGFDNVIKSNDKLHAVSKFDIATGEQEKKNSQFLSFSKIFGKKISLIAQADKKVVAITAAMPSGTGLEDFMNLHPDKFFDVGIAEQHAVTFAAGIAAQGLKPYVAIYSTFLQRAYDQIVHDVAIQNLPVKFAIDRAGFVGSDGPTHAGSFDISYLINLPNFILMAPSSGQELIKAINTANEINDKPCAFRYPRADASEKIDFSDCEILEIGKSKIVAQGSKIAIIAAGTIIEEAFAANEDIKNEFGFSASIIDARFLKPLDTEMLKFISNNYEVLIVVEEGATGGFGSAISKYMLDESLLDNGLKLRCLSMVDKFIEQNSIKNMRTEARISKNEILEIVRKIL